MYFCLKRAVHFLLFMVYYLSRSKETYSYPPTLTISSLCIHCHVSGKWGCITTTIPTHKGSNGTSALVASALVGSGHSSRLLDSALPCLHHHSWALKGNGFQNKSLWIKTSHPHKALGKMWYHGFQGPSFLSVPFHKNTCFVSHYFWLSHLS